MQVFYQIVAFSALQTDGSDRPVLTKGKHPKIEKWGYQLRRYSKLTTVKKFESCCSER